MLGKTISYIMTVCSRCDLIAKPRRRSRSSIAGFADGFAQVKALLGRQWWGRMIEGTGGFIGPLLGQSDSDHVSSLIGFRDEETGTSLLVVVIFGSKPRRELLELVKKCGLDALAPRPKLVAPPSGDGPADGNELVARESREQCLILLHPVLRHLFDSLEQSDLRNRGAIRRHPMVQADEIWSYRQNNWGTSPPVG